MKTIGVILTASAGDGTKEIVTGQVNKIQKVSLDFLEMRLPSFVEVVDSVSGDVEPSGFNVLDYVKWWLCQGDTDKYEELESLTIDKFCTVVEGM